jgi:hypothetical protein
MKSIRQVGVLMIMIISTWPTGPATGEWLLVTTSSHSRLPYVLLAAPPVASVCHPTGM